MQVCRLKLYEDYKVINTDVSELLTVSPNNSMNSFDFINQIETVRNEKGNAYVLIERDIYQQPEKTVSYKSRCCRNGDRK
ncbi:HK97 family phage portal protein [Staphylococcus gallinarum]|uniref:HK97 family phage portal protein n=1 Tax=Staphylococcus gallinarum TaxID=1293 RepID=A0A380FED7_STAGA|nr:HK97 family phage portal protein [Staphylococcus gallinarum]